MSASKKPYTPRKPKLRAEFLAGSPTIELLNVYEVAHMLGVTHHTVQRRRKLPTFPQPKKQSSRCVQWRKSEIIAWINAA